MTEAERIDSRPDTYAHILVVQHYLRVVVEDLLDRMERHDLSKLESPEIEAYDVMVPRLRDAPYDSEQYRATLREMKPAVQHHYDRNPHHPEGHADGILGMSLVDLIEMLADWQAAARRQAEPVGLAQSINHNQQRFGYSDDVKRLLLNTVAIWETHHD